MDRYLQQLLADIEQATRTIQFPYPKPESSELAGWVSEEEDEETALRKTLEEWTGIKKEQLPPPEDLTPEELTILLKALEKMLEACNCLVVFQIQVPEYFQYKVVREMFHQESTWFQWHMNFFNFCEKDQEHYTCSLGEFCHCGFFYEHFTHHWEEHERAERERLENKFRERYGDEWERFYECVKWYKEEVEQTEEDWH